MVKSKKQYLEFSMQGAQSELNAGIIGMGVWGYILTKAGYSPEQIKEYVQHIPETIRLREILCGDYEKVVSTIKATSSIRFWERLGFKFSHNANASGFSWDQFSDKNLCESGVYVANVHGTHPNREFHDQLKSIPEGYEITESGVQLTAEFAHAFCLGRFINPNHMVRCIEKTHEGKEVLLSVGGGEKFIRQLRFYKDGTLPNRLACIGIQKKCFSIT